MPLRAAGLIVAALLVSTRGAPADRGVEDGQAILAVWQTRALNGNTGAQGALVVDPATLHPLAPPLWLPGRSLTSGLTVSPDGRIAAVVTADSSASDRTKVVYVRTDRFERIYPVDALVLPQDIPLDIRIGPGDGAWESRAVILTRAADRAGGRVLFIGMRIEGDALVTGNLSVTELPFTPAAMAVDDTFRRAFVLTAPGRRSSNILRISLSGESIAGRGTMTGAVDAGLDGRRALVLLGRGERIMLLASGNNLREGPGRPLTVARQYDAESLEPLGEAIELAGWIGAGEPMTRLDADRFWASTYAASGAFGYATRIASTAAGLEKLVEESWVQSNGAPVVAAFGEATALASGAGLRVLRNGGAPEMRVDVPEPIEALAWVGGDVVAGAGSMLYRFDAATGEIAAKSGRLPGFVVAMETVARPVAAGAVTTPGAYPQEVMLAPSLPGRSEFAMPLDVPSGYRAVVDLDDSARPWLRATQSELADGTPLLELSVRGGAGTDGPSRLDGWFRVALRDDSGAAVRSEARVEVSASAPADRTPVIQWQGSHSAATHGAGSAELMRQLAGAPLHFSHRVRSGPLVSPPPASVVVLGMDAAMEGALTRQVLLDYVASGGGLLFVGRYVPESDADGVRRWLEPLDIVIDPGRRIDDAFDSTGSRSLMFGAAQLAVASGCYVETLGPMDIRVPANPEYGAALAMRKYGYGRIAVLASATPLEPESLARSEGRQFARALFAWLAGSRTETRDRDLDGVPDAVEDRNGNHRVDPGETSFVVADTDGDGVPDGMEDANLNGRVDEGETDPRRADTDGDGIADGADADPLPAAGRPILLALNPTEGPAEGGTVVELRGRNLPVKADVWFGDTRSPHVVRVDSERVLAAAPERPGDEMRVTTDVRIARVPGVYESRLDGAYTYRDRSHARLMLDSVSRARRAYDGYRGQATLVLEVPEVRVEYVDVRLWAEPGMEHLDLQVERSEQLAALGRTVTIRRFGLMEHRVTVGPGEPMTGRVELATLSWRIAEVPARAERLRLFFRYPDVRAQWGGTLSGDLKETWIDLLGAEDPGGP